MHACTYAHKHNDVCTHFLPRYIILPMLLRHCWTCRSLKRKVRRDGGRVDMQAEYNSIQSSAARDMPWTQFKAVQLFSIPTCTSNILSTMTFGKSSNQLMDVGLLKTFCMHMKQSKKTWPRQTAGLILVDSKIRKMTINIKTISFSFR